MARKRAAKGSKVRSTGAAARSTVRSLGLFGAVAAALAGGGYYLGRNGPPLPEKIAALLPSQKPAPKAAQAPEARPDAKPAESAIVKVADKAELARLLKGAEAKIVGYVRPEPEKRARKAETNKPEASKADSTRAESAKVDAVKADTKAKSSKMQVAKSEAAKTPTEADAPMPPARIPDAGKAEAKSRARSDAQTAPRSDDAPASIAEALAEPEAAPASAPATTSASAPTSAADGGGSAPLGVALTGKGIPTSEDGKIRLSVGFSNRTGKPIRAFEGVLKFTDRADRGLFSSKISVSALIAEGGAINWDERVDPEKLGKKLVDADKDSLKAVFVPKKVFFVDGSVQQFGAKGERFAQR